VWDMTGRKEMVDLFGHAAALRLPEVLLREQSQVMTTPPSFGLTARGTHGLPFSAPGSDSVAVAFLN
jgi:hypothetical protein